MCNFQGTIEWVRQSNGNALKIYFHKHFYLYWHRHLCRERGNFVSELHSFVIIWLSEVSFRMEITRFELVTPCLQGRCSPNWAIPPYKVSLMFYLNFIIFNGMGLSGLEPPTSRLSGVRSNRLSYKPILIWQPPAFPYRLQYSIIGRLSLNHRVRDVDGCFP